MSTRQTVTIQGPDDRQRIATWARNVEAGTVVTFRKKSRSTEQSAKMWAMLHEVSEQVEWYGQKIDAEDWKDMFTASLRHARVVPGIDKGTFVPLGMRTSTMTIEEMTNLIELIYAFGAQHNVIFKEPKQSSSDGSAPQSSVDAGMKPAEGEVETPPDASPSNLFPIDRADLIECCRKMMFIAVDPSLETPKQRQSTLIAAKDMWKGQLPEELHAHIKAFVESVDAQIKADPRVMPALREKALAHFSEGLNCNLSDLGGVDG